MSDDLIPGYIVKVIYTTARCTERINPKRPTWRCKNIATWLWQARDPEPDGRRKADYKCDDHKDRIAA